MSEQATFDRYLVEQDDQGHMQGEHAARRGDPDGFEAALDAIRILAAIGQDFTADDTRDYLASPGNELGAAFATLRRSGEIHVVGYSVARMPSAHRRLVRVWRGTEP